MTGAKDEAHATLVTGSGPERSLLMERLQHQFPERRDEWGKFMIGAYTYGMPVVRSWGEDAILQVGKFCSIADQVTVFLGGEHRVNWVSTYPFSALLPEFSHIQGHPKSKGDVIIGNDVWIAHGVTILSGVHIGDGAVIGAKAVVSRDVPPYTIVAGNPGAIVKNRFEPGVIARLQDIRWWDWELKYIEEAVPLLLSQDVEGLIQYAENHALGRKLSL
ncbi:acetyltransferase [Paenibacillus sp. J23TS9]|nr:acetyltransferase [Paenibacillus sp. J23TS9]